MQTHVLLGQTRAQVLDGTLRMVTELGVASIQVVHMRAVWRRPTSAIDGAGLLNPLRLSVEGLCCQR